MASDDWVASIANDVRRMGLAGTSEDVLQAFIDSRRRGDNERAESILSLSLQQVHPPRPAMTSVDKLRVAALRPVVNAIDSSTLYSYIGIVWPITEEIVRGHEDPTHWAHESFVDAIAQSLVRVVLEHLQVKIVIGA